MEIRKVACVGAGLIGQGWATLFASKGFDVTLQDMNEIILERSAKGIISNLMFLEANHLLAPGEADTAIMRIKTSTSMGQAARDADYVQESVPDNYDVKRRVFKELDAVAPQHAILASSSSGLLMTEVQKVTLRPERCVLVHPCLPVHLLPLVEIVGGQQTSPDAVTTARDLMKRLGKTPVILKREVSGYIVNRLQAAILREAIDLVDKGVASAEDVDKAFCFGIGLRDPIIGPFLRVHLAGNGIEGFIENYSQSYHYRWRTMETWTSISPSAAEATIKGVREMGVVQTRSLEEIKSWRDQMLVKILQVISKKD